MKCPIFALCLLFVVGMDLPVYSDPKIVSKDDFLGKYIKIINIDCINDLTLEENLLFNLAIQPGDPFSSEKVRESLKEIYRAGDFSQVYVEAQLWQDGLKLIFCPIARLRVSSVEIAGNKALSIEEIDPGKILGPGDRFAKEKVQKLQERLQSLYADHGFYNVEITPIIHTEERNLTVAVRLEVAEGAPGQIGQIIFVGNEVFKDSTLYNKLGIKVGENYDKSELEQGFIRIRDLYRNEGYLLARIREMEKSFDRVSQRITLTLQILEGGQVEFIEGDKTVKPNKILEREAINKIQSYHPRELREVAREAENYYKNKGYYLAEVSFKETQRNGKEVIVFSIDKKNKVAIKEISFEGNQAFSDRTLRDLMQTKPKSLFSRGQPTEKGFREDLRVIKNFYLRHGYLKADVRLESLNYSEDRKWMFITLSISEGVQSLVKEIEFRGNTFFTSEKLSKIILVKLHDPVNPNQIRDSATAIQSEYAQQGYIKARVEPDVKLNADGREATIIFSITEENVYYIGDITIGGIVDTREKFVKREILLREGDVYNPEKIRKTVRNILKLGIYDRVRFEPEGPPEEGEEDPAGNSYIQDMFLSVRETKTKSLEFGLGYSTDTQFNGSVEFTDKNLLGYGGRGSFKVTGGPEVFKILANYLQPHFFDRHLSLVADLFDDLNTTPISFDSNRRGGGLALDYEFSDTTKAALGFNFTQTDLSSVRADAILDPALDTGIVDLGRLTFRISRDNRNNLLNPTRGSFHLIQTDAILDLLGSDTEAIKITGQTSWYFPLFRRKRSVLAFSLRGGLAEPLSDSSGIPIFERFFAGGDSTIRGFEQEKVGPLGTGGSPIGGDVFLIFNGELRFPLYKFIGGVLFLDVGNVWLQDLDLDLTDLRYVAGTGLRVNTPIGLVRVEYGFKLNPLSDESLGGWHVAIGLPF